jgi:hypothetical protein
VLSPDSTFNISIIPVNDPPALSVNQPLVVSENESATLSGSFLQYVDNDNLPGELRYTITSAPSSGVLQSSGSDLTTGDTFTQEDLIIGLISYKHNGSETTGDSFNFSLGDGTTNLTSSFNITVLPVNDRPTISTTPITVNENASVPILPSILNAVDPDTPPAQILYTLTGGPVFGNLKRNNGTTLTVGSTFTQAEINSGVLNYTHNGSENPTDVFVFQVSDGASPADSGIINITVKPVNDPPSLALNSGLVVNSSLPTTRVISNSQLRATDVDNLPPEQVLFRLTAIPNPAVGVLKLGNTPLTVGQTFSQRDIDQNRVSYQYLGNGSSDGFQFTLVDSGGATGGSAFFPISFTR